MDRLELIREQTDAVIQKLVKEEERKFAYIHTYGVAQAAAMLATLRKLDVELCCIAAMLHDIALYAQNCPHLGHAQRSAEYAKLLLEKMEVFSEEEIRILTHVISVHSDKMNRHDGPISELLKDADVLQHYLYNPKIELSEKDKVRLFYLLEDLNCAQVEKQLSISASKLRVKRSIHRGCPLYTPFPFLIFPNCSVFKLQFCIQDSCGFPHTAAL